MSCFYVRPIGFPESEHAWLEAILTLGHGRLRHDWRWTTEGSADAYLAAVKSPAQWQGYRAELPPGRLIACALPDLELDARWRVRRDREHPPGLRELTGVLNELGDELAAGPVAVAEPPVPTPASSPEIPAPQRAEEPTETFHTSPTAGEVYDPEHYLIGIVREALADGAPRRLACADGGDTVLIEPERQLYFVPDDKVFLGPILSAPRHRIDVRRLASAELARDTAAIQAHGLPLADLMFLSALAGSEGRLWIGCRADEPVRLRQWPDLKPLLHYVEYVNLAAFMSSNTADVRTIAAHTGAGVEKVVNFHNACAALGLLERGGELSIRQKPVSAGVRELYQKIAKRLHGEA
jgi:hypothetical protein